MRECRHPAPASAMPDKPTGLAEDSTIRETAIKIYLLRAAGQSDEQIAQIVGLSTKTLSSYVYKAGKMGWLDDFLHDPRERLEYSIMHKVVRNLDQSLDSEGVLQTGMQERTAVALKIAEGALYPRLQQGAGQQNSMLMGIKIEVVGGEPQKIREGTVIEAPAYVEDGAE